MAPSAGVQQMWHDEATSVQDLGWVCTATSVTGNSTRSEATYWKRLTGQVKTISLVRDRFPLPELRQVEIIRQLA